MDKEYEKDEWKEQEEKMLKYMSQTDMEQNYMKMYSRFSNFPSNIKKGIIINAIILCASAILMVLCILKLKYYSPLLIVAYILLTVILGWKIITTFFYLRHAHFITFTGRITESHVVGTKLMNNKHHVIKLVADDGKELSFPYYENSSLYFDQYITLFINNNAEIIPSSYGPYIERYIEAVPTDEIKSRMEMFGEFEDGSMGARDYIDH